MIYSGIIVGSAFTALWVLTFILLDPISIYSDSIAVVKKALVEIYSKFFGSIFSETKTIRL